MQNWLINFNNNNIKTTFRVSTIEDLFQNQCAQMKTTFSALQIWPFPASFFINNSSFQKGNANITANQGGKISTSTQYRDSNSQPPLTAIRLTRVPVHQFESSIKIIVNLRDCF